MKKIISVLILFMIMGGSIGFTQENPYAIQTKVIENEQAIENLRRQQANLYLKIEDLLVKYGELKGRLDSITRRLEAIDAKLNNGVYAHNAEPIKDNNKKAEKQTQKTTNLHAAQTITSSAPIQNKPETKKEIQTPTKQEAQAKVQQATQQPSVENKKTDRELYVAAKRLYEKKLYTDAIKLFNRLKEEYKDSKYTPDAIFFIAESYFNKRIYDKAIINYDYLINTYPNSKYVPKAVLKEGISFINLGDNIDGKYLLKKVISDYPTTQEAKDAQEYLSRMK